MADKSEKEDEFQKPGSVGRDHLTESWNPGNNTQSNDEEEDESTGTSKDD